MPHQTSHIPEFTAEESELAEREGWNLFNEESCPQIQRDDETGIFETDEDAIAFVKGSGAPHAMRALAIVAAFVPPTENERETLESRASDSSEDG